MPTGGGGENQKYTPRTVIPRRVILCFRVQQLWNFVCDVTRGNYMSMSDGGGEEMLQDNKPLDHSVVRFNNSLEETVAYLGAVPPPQAKNYVWRE